MNFYEFVLVVTDKPKKDHIGWLEAQM